jgi:PAS domain S-box-containing protein
VKTENSGHIGGLLEPILRGAAKILGCSTAVLVVLSERTRTARVRIGVQGETTPLLSEVDVIFGSSLNGLTVPYFAIEDSLVFASWRSGTILETSSMEELVGGGLPREPLRRVGEMIGAHRLVCVPVGTRVRRYGVLILAKVGGQPFFSRQQRELMLRYAARIGAIVENDLWGEGEMLLADAGNEPQRGEPLYLLLDGQGNEVGRGEGAKGAPPAGEREALPAEVLAEVRARAAALVRGETAGTGAPAPGGRDGTPVEVGIPGSGGLGRRRFLVEMTPLRVAGRELVLCRLCEPRRPADSSLENLLLQLAVGEPAPSLFVDTDFRITSCNRATEVLCGRSAPELRGRPVQTLFREPHDVLRLLDPQLLLLTSGYGEETTAVRRADASLVPARIEAVLLADQGGRPAGFLLLIRPRPEADAGAEGLMRRERLATMGEMAAQLAHELRNPLVAIGATLESLGAELRDHDGGEPARVLADVSREIVRLDMLLKDYLSLAARQDALLARVDLARVLGESCELLRRTGKLGRRELAADVPPGIVVLADSEGLRHVFFNLLLNAVEATGDEGRIRCRAEPGEHDLTVFVDDDGTGLAAPSEQCLEPFFTTKENGSGLGLAVCSRIVQAHGGTIYLQNREPRGCRVAVALPRSVR